MIVRLNQNSSLSVRFMMQQKHNDSSSSYDMQFLCQFLKLGNNPESDLLNIPLFILFFIIN